MGMLIMNKAVNAPQIDQRVTRSQGGIRRSKRDVFLDEGESADGLLEIFWFFIRFALLKTFSPGVIFFGSVDFSIRCHLLEVKAGG